MYVPSVDIQILTAAGNLRMSRVARVEIVSSAKVLEDTATIELPTTARLVREGEYITEVETAKQFAVGDEIAINMGYNGRLEEEFYGFVSRIKPGTPLVVECVDAVWLLRRKNISKSWKTTTLRAVLEHCLEGTGIVLDGEVPSITLAPYYIKNVSAASALQKIKDVYGLKMFFKAFKALVVGYSEYNDNKAVKYEFGSNIVDSDLEWVAESDTRIRIKAVHIKKDNTKIEKEYGDPDGELRTVYFYNLPNGSDLERMALSEARKYQYTGYKGGITTFLWPNVRVGNVARLTDPLYAERAGDYLVDKVVTTLSERGARRKIELGLKLTNG